MHRRSTLGLLLALAVASGCAASWPWSASATTCADWVQKMTDDQRLTMVQTEIQKDGAPTGTSDPLQVVAAVTAACESIGGPTSTVDSAYGYVYFQHVTPSLDLPSFQP
jgi:hypothetical protein